MTTMMKKWELLTLAYPGIFNSLWLFPRRGEGGERRLDLLVERSAQRLGAERADLDEDVALVRRGPLVGDRACCPVAL